MASTPQRRLSLSFKNSASLDVIEYELEDFAPSPQACEEVDEVVPYAFSQGAPFFALKEVCEDDRYYLLKMISLAPNKPYVPSFLRDKCLPTDETYEFQASCSDEEEVGIPSHETCPEEVACQEACIEPETCPEPEILEEHESSSLSECKADVPLSLEEEQEVEAVLCEGNETQCKLVQAEVRLLEEDLLQNDPFLPEEPLCESALDPSDPTDLPSEEPVCNDTPAEEVVQEECCLASPPKVKAALPYNKQAELYRQRVEQALKFQDNQALAEILFGIKSNGLDAYFDNLDVIEDLAFSD